MTTSRFVKLSASLSLLSAAACDGVVIVDEAPSRVEYTGSMFAYAACAISVLVVAGVLLHLHTRWRTPARGNAVTICYVALGVLAILFLAEKPIITHVLVDG